MLPDTAYEFGFVNSYAHQLDCKRQTWNICRQRDKPVQRALFFIRIPASVGKRFILPDTFPITLTVLPSTSRRALIIVLPPLVDIRLRKPCFWIFALHLAEMSSSLLILGYILRFLPTHPVSKPSFN